MAMLATRAKDPTDAVFGMSPDGKVVHFCLSTAPHLLIAGTTGSGKSVALNQICVTMMQHATPKELRFMIIDPKKVEFSRYKNSPYMLINPVTDLKDAYDSVKYLTIEMDDRYSKLAQAGVRNIESYNKWAKKNNKEEMFYIVLLVDEFSDLIMQYRDIEEPIIRLGQKARAAGIHVMIATQSPRATVITGLIKANFPSRMSLMVASSLESGIILDETGAESLRPHGDMLIKLNGRTPIRVQGSFISDEELDAIFDYQIKNFPEPEFVDFKNIVANFDEEQEGEGGSKRLGGFSSGSIQPKKKKYMETSAELSPFQKKREAQKEEGFKPPSLKKLREDKMKRLSELMGEPDETEKAQLDKSDNDDLYDEAVSNETIKKESSSPLMRKKTTSPLMQKKLKK